MKRIDEITTKLSENKNHLHNKYGVSALGVFGSFARGEEKQSSDIDILVEFDRPIGLEFVDLADELERLLGSKIDLVSRRAIKSKFMEFVKQELIYV